MQCCSGLYAILAGVRRSVTETVPSAMFSEQKMVKDVGEGVKTCG